MTALLTENARLRAALDGVIASYDRSNPMRTADMHLLTCKCLRCTVDEARTILATPAPDAVQEAARVLLADGVAMQTLVDFQLRHSATASAKARSMRHVQMKAALRTIAGERT